MFLWGIDLMDARYKELSMFYKEVWWSLSSELNLNMNTYSYTEKIKKEKEFNTLIDRIIKYIESFPKDESKRLLWRQKGNKYLDKIISTEGIFKLGVIDKDMKDNFIRSTKDFINASKCFNTDMSYEDIGQAMRNLWIVNMLQQAFGESIKFNNGVFGYSMLYPYTDNYLDNTEITIEEKKDFNERFTKRLNGEKVSSINEHEKQVYKLVEFIESQFNREKYPEVYNSLSLIHRGQIFSLRQQEKQSIPYERDILGISIEKGGASVIADGNLIRGEMTKSEEMFSYGYGFLLQLGDDLQDIKSDKENNHITIMSQLAGEYELDVIVNKLINLTLKVVDDAECFVCNNSSELKELIKENCIYMVLFAIVDNKEYFSETYIDKIIKYLPFTLEYCENLKENIFNKFKKLNKEYYGVQVEEILMYFVE